MSAKGLFFHTPTGTGAERVGPHRAPRRCGLHQCPIAGPEPGWIRHHVTWSDSAKSGLASPGGSSVFLTLRERRDAPNNAACKARW